MNESVRHSSKTNFRVKSRKKEKRKVESVNKKEIEREEEREK